MFQRFDICLDVFLIEANISESCDEDNDVQLIANCLSSHESRLAFVAAKLQMQCNTQGITIRLGSH